MFEVEIRFLQKVVGVEFALLKPMDSPMWELQVSGQSPKTVTGEQASAIAALFVGELESVPATNEALYNLAEPVMGTLPPEARIIP